MKQHRPTTLLSAFAAAALLAALAPAVARAHEQPAGQPVERNGMQIMAVYLQPVPMAPPIPGQNPAKADVHLEADIHATAHNQHGFPQDAWIPYLQVRYSLAKKGSNWKTEGRLFPMTAKDGPHYGANVKLDGPGAYQLVFHIEPPSVNGFLRHTDAETGVAPWWAPFDYKGAFNFVGTGKKGGY